MSPDIDMGFPWPRFVNHHNKASLNRYLAFGGVQSSDEMNNCTTGENQV
ncbi:hypothetical protein NC651_002683 [Populus alba x Populus x berolinensis]|nr:hypothetical protein NC651_002683 [Populus alba x Populus x berolinensis]